MSKEVLMTQGSIPRAMISFTIPIFLGQLFQQLYNTADSLIVGNLLGSHALAAVSSSANLTFLLVGFFNGMAMGASVVISQEFGARNYSRLSRTIHTTLALGLVISIILSLLGTWMAPQILVWMSTPSEVMPLSTEYLAIYFGGISGLILYNLLSGILRAVGDSRTPLIFLMISSILNVVLDLVFIAVFHWGIGGAAWATIASQFFSALLALIFLMKSHGVARVELSKIRFHAGELWQIIRYGIPTGVQNSIISLANVVVQTNINVFGPEAMAGCGAYSKLEGFAFLPIMSFNMAISTFVGQNIGARERERTLKGSRFGILCGVISCEIVGILFFIFAPSLVSLFDSNPAVIAFGADRARCNALFYFLLACTHAVSAVLRGGGKPMSSMVVMLLTWCLIRVGLLNLFAGYHNIWFVYWVYPITWSLSSIIFMVYYHSKTWLPADLRNQSPAPVSQETAVFAAADEPALHSHGSVCHCACKQDQ